jgi:ABC-type branched-subunit amino acid transport system ATPase component
MSRPAGDPAPPDSERARIDCVGISTSFGGNRVHRDLDLTMTGGHIVGLIGPNGCGKSTLLDVITGAVRPVAGSVRLNGSDISGLPPYRRYRLGITRSFQGLELFEGMSIRDNLRVAFGSSRRHADAVDSVLEQVGLAELADRLPRELGYGQRKVLSLARLYGRGASIVLLDEPAAGLSAEEVGPVLAIAADLARSGAVICLVEHNMKIMAEVATTVHLMAGGRIMASGPPASLLADEELAGVFFGRTRQP